MDPITAAIVAAIIAGVTAGATDVGQKIIVDAYEGLKGAIKAKFGAQSDLSMAIESVEDKPESEGRKATLQEEVEAVHAEEVAEIMEAVARLEEALAAHGDERVQTMLNSARGKQTMRGRGGTMKQDMSHSPDAEQTME